MTARGSVTGSAASSATRTWPIRLIAMNRRSSPDSSTSQLPVVMAAALPGGLP